MKKLLVIFAFVPFLVSCNQEKLEQLSQENVELKEESASKDSTINEFIRTINEIEENLALIKEKEEDLISISANAKGENAQNAREAIIQDLKSINNLMEENRQKLASLNEKVNNSDIRISEFNRMVSELNNGLEERKSEITNMQEQLKELKTVRENLTFTVDTLESKVSDLSLANRNKEDMINQQINALHTAYVASGTYRDLKEKGVIDKKGGIIGIGSVKKLVKDFNTDMFERIDITNTSSIPLNGKKATVITVHPTESYKITGEKEKDVDSLLITNPEEFWKASKYLVVVVD
jgi:DNA repair exonuclease SbcCD ATPase subunit